MAPPPATIAANVVAFASETNALAPAPAVPAAGSVATVTDVVLTYGAVKNPVTCVSPVAFNRRFTKPDPAAVIDEKTKSIAVPETP